MKQLLVTAALLLYAPLLLFAQSGEVRGTLTDTQTHQPLAGATALLIGTTFGASSDASGAYAIRNVPAGQYRLRVTYVGYTTVERRIDVADAAVTIDVALSPTVIEKGEVVVEVNRAHERETPVAFTTVDKLQIEQNIHGQDAPLLVQGVPGVYTYSTDGVGNGEGQLLVRGFSQNYVQVLINGVPTNDPESNAVYWSNWGSVSSSAASIQVQRGAGSSLYGAGSFGGSFNIVTADAPARPFYAANLSLGSPVNTLYGIDLNSGLIDNTFAGALRIDRKIAEGSRTSGRYEGINYYTSLSWFPTAQQSLKIVLHGAPQEHGYSYSNHISYFKKYGYKANSAPFLPRDVAEKLPVNATTDAKNYGLLDDSRELVDPNYVNLSHNFFHKPQVELHYRYDLNPMTSLNATAFYSKGRGGGSSLNSTGTMFSLNRDTIVSYLNADGVIGDSASAAGRYLGNAFQRISYSFHQQGGVLASVDLTPLPSLKMTLGGEFRSWTADHPGHFTNLYGKRSVSFQYARRDTLGRVMSSTFRRTVYQGDLSGPEGDLGNIFAWDLAGANDPTYRTQYRNYRGETPQYTIFTQGNYQLDRLNILGSLQYVWYKYKLTEYMPSENAIGTMLTRAQEASRGSLREGPTGDGKFLMLGQDSRWYEFDLVNTTRERGFWQPKIGLNYNLTENVNLFGNFAHVERFVDLGIYYNQGRVAPNVGDEKSNQFELGAGWTSGWLRSKLNVYHMTWDNKSARIQDVSKAGEPGYDRNGYRSELVGTSVHKGLEFEFTLGLNEVLPVKGFELTGSMTLMDNTWKSVLNSVKTDPLTGARRPFSTSSLNSAGAVDTIFFDEMEGTPVASGPQTMIFAGLNYRDDRFFTGVDMFYAARNFLLDGGTYMAVDGTIETRNGKDYFVAQYSRKLPRATVFNYNFGYRFDLYGIHGTASVQVLNLFDTEYLAAADRNGVIPGALRTFRFNITAGL